jgi:hypothetical protein
MRIRITTSLIALALISCGRVHGGEGESPVVPPPPSLQRFRPAGGWNPYGGGLLHWWNPHCFPCQTAPDDYCRKPLPEMCWPPYPPYYVWGPPEIVYPTGHGSRDLNKPR